MTSNIFNVKQSLDPRLCIGVVYVKNYRKNTFSFLIYMDKYHHTKQYEIDLLKRKVKRFRNKDLVSG